MHPPAPAWSILLVGPGASVNSEHQERAFPTQKEAKQRRMGSPKMVPDQLMARRAQQEMEYGLFLKRIELLVVLSLHPFLDADDELVLVPGQVANAREACYGCCQATLNQSPQQSPRSSGFAHAFVNESPSLSSRKKTSNTNMIIGKHYNGDRRSRPPLTIWAMGGKP